MHSSSLKDRYFIHRCLITSLSRFHLQRLDLVDAIEKTVFFTSIRLTDNLAIIINSYRRQCKLFLTSDQYLGNISL